MRSGDIVKNSRFDVVEYCGVGDHIPREEVFVGCLRVDGLQEQGAETDVVPHVQAMNQPSQRSKDPWVQTVVQFKHHSKVITLGSARVVSSYEMHLGNNSLSAFG